MLDEAIAVAVKQAVKDALAEGPDAPRVLNLDGAARYCGTSPAVIKRLILDGHLSALRVGREFRIGVKVIDEMLAKGAVVESSAR